MTVKKFAVRVLYVMEDPRIMGFKFHYNQVLCLLFLFLYTGFEVNSTVICNPKESLALLQFKNTTPVELTASPTAKYVCTPQTLSWVGVTDCCFWKGVTCDNVTGNVIGLDLSSSSLTGTIHDNNTLFQLSHLQWLNLNHNIFYDPPISSVFGLLRDLTHLNLSTSGFSGLVPSEISHLSKLVSVDLGFNGLRFEPQNFALLESNGVFSAVQLEQSTQVVGSLFTSFKGEIPHAVGNLKFLEGIFLSSCSFTGPIPASFGNLTQLTDLWLDENALTGQVPSSMSKLEQLTHIQLSWNSLAGQIPNFGNLSKLTFLSPSWNNFSGPLPYHVSRRPYLTDIDLSHNFLSGKVPPELFSLPSLQTLRLSDNTFSAPIEQFEPSNSLSDVDLSNNKISGSIPSSMFKL
ncbi:receptor-like protein 9DC3 [Pistacia vera]|uniref:receptor-like protein 9DC3 n=1 Tax=Pistacia vera TaxID=55513 RepID=UPI001262FA6A|nr:receptor-like protein 9DC3 [Pistacia vera]